MRLALIADIHANAIALDAVLTDLSNASVNQVVCLGDVAATGPQPHDVIARLRELGCPVVMGNTDLASTRPMRVSPADEEGRRFTEIDAWCDAQLTAEDIAFIRTFQPTILLPLSEGATILCYHGSPQSNTDAITATTSETTLAPMLDGHSATVLAGGHTHQPFIRRYRGALLMNPGSVGLPYEIIGREARNPPWAEYGIVESHDRSLHIELRRIPIDAGLVVRAALQSGMPHAEWWASDWR